ncbi:MAG: tyrosine phosphatase-like protein [Benjaminiella poitrasii]|nr:MAG: tyrosine phosphatase-like protein [Benjaminiella poitrasii]
MSKMDNDTLPPPPGPRNFKEWYLLSYNQVSFLGWSWILYSTITTLHESQYDTSHLFDVVWPSLQYVQTAALMEVVHAMLGLVRTPVMTTAMQVASRLFLVWAVNAPLPEIHAHPSFATMVLAWSVAELVRYMYYIFLLSNGGTVVPGIVAWLRYNAFLVLYPVGVASELVMVYQALPYANALSPLYFYALIAVALVYIPGFPVLFSHMLVQRRKYQRGELKSMNNKKDN